MKTTVEIPDLLFRRAKAKAAERGQTLKEFLSEALREKLGTGSGASRRVAPPWMRGFGALRHLRRETAHVQQRVDEAFEVIEPEDRA
jgi:hypothetical protein